ncbi:MAG: carbon-nitrogen family hydrolase [Deltaproteobacteria bacterium]|nr:carbon-nitrogen family hydrolase [Candidatus Anaeroferrophillacea bacterium]
MSPSLTISLVQMNVAHGDPTKNLHTAERFIARAPATTELFLLPEMWTTGYDFARFPELAVSTPGILDRIKRLARDRRAAIGGTVLEADGGSFYNTFHLVDADGTLRARYRKIHLFSLMDEPRWLAPGNRAVITEIKGIPTGLMTCYDLRFAELARTLTAAGARLLLVSAQWPRPRARHWRALLPARALENQVFVAACNRFGTGTAHTFAGHSGIFDPWGETVAAAPRHQGVTTATINLRQVDAVRRLLDTAADRRPEVYAAGVERLGGNPTPGYQEPER